MKWLLCKCGRHNSADSKFCGSCGAPLSPDVEGQEQPEPMSQGQTALPASPLEVNIVKADIPFGDVLTLSWKWFGAGLIVGLVAVPIFFILMAIFVAMMLS